MYGKVHMNRCSVLLASQYLHKHRIKNISSSCSHIRFRCFVIIRTLDDRRIYRPSTVHGKLRKSFCSAMLSSVTGHSCDVPANVGHSSTVPTGNRCTRFTREQTPSATPGLGRCGPEPSFERAGEIDDRR